MEHTARDPDDAAVFPDLDPELDGLPLRVRAEVPALTVSCAASPRPAVPARPPEPETRPAAASTFAPTHHRATNALASVASKRSSTTMSLPLLPWCGVRADRRSPMRIDSGVVEPFDFRCRRRPTTNFTRPRTRSSNPVPSSGESDELGDLCQPQRMSRLSAPTRRSKIPRPPGNRPASVRVADVGGEEFEEAHRHALAGRRHKRRHGWRSEADKLVH